MKLNVVRWFYQVWPFESERGAALRGYSVLAREKYTLADIALRGGVFSAPHRAAGDTFGDGIAEGRRLLALEILELANADYADIWQRIPKAPPPKERD